MVADAVSIKPQGRVLVLRDFLQHILDGHVFSLKIHLIFLTPLLSRFRIESINKNLHDFLSSFRLLTWKLR